MRDPASVSLCVERGTYAYFSFNIQANDEPSWYILISLLAQTRIEHFMYQDNHAMHTTTKDTHADGQSGKATLTDCQGAVTGPCGLTLSPWAPCPSKTLPCSCFHVYLIPSFRFPLQEADRKDSWELMSSCWPRGWLGQATPSHRGLP